MKSLKSLLTLGALAGALVLGSVSSLAQDQNPGRGGGGGQRGNFDPEQMRQRMMERMREQFGIKDDDEWKIVSERIAKVTEARRSVGGGMGMGMGGFGRGGRPPGGNGGAGGAGGEGGRSGRGPQGSPEEQALQKALDDKASAEVIKEKLTQVRDARKAGEEKLKTAQAQLKEVLDTRQEAVAVLMGLLP